MAEFKKLAELLEDTLNNIDRKTLISLEYILYPGGNKAIIMLKTCFVKVNMQKNAKKFLYKKCLKT